MYENPMTISNILYPLNGGPLKFYAQGFNLSSI